MSAEPISGTAVASAGLAGASVFGLATGIDYGVVFGAFAGGLFRDVVYCRGDRCRPSWVIPGVMDTL